MKRHKALYILGCFSCLYINGRRNKMGRNHEIKIRLNDYEYYDLQHKVAKTGLSREQYLRTLIREIKPSSMPSVELIDYIKHLRYIGNNLNQLTIKAHQTNYIYFDEVRKIRDELYLSISDIKKLMCGENPINKEMLRWQ